jgi:hypothetical protein
MNELPICVQYIQALGPTVVAVVVGAVAGYVAWRQWRTAHDKLAFDLYEKRFKVYEAVESIISAATVHDPVTLEEFIEFHRAIIGAEFLFDGDTRDFIVKIGQMAWRARNAREQRERSGHHPQTDNLINEEEGIVSFLLGQEQALEKMFRPYLDLSRVGLAS